MNAPADLALLADRAPDGPAALASRAARQAAVVAALAPLLPAHALLWHGEDTTPYECDGLTAIHRAELDGPVAGVGHHHRGRRAAGVQRVHAVVDRQLAGCHRSALGVAFS
jgi:hypothetical protein